MAHKLAKGSFASSEKTKAESELVVLGSGVHMSDFNGQGDISHKRGPSYSFVGADKVIGD